MTTALKLAPLLLGWGVMVLALGRFYSAQRGSVAAAAAVGFLAGVAGENLLFSFMPAELPFRFLRWLCGGIFLALWGTSVAAIYRSGSDSRLPSLSAPRFTPLLAGCIAGVAGALAGAVALCRMAPLDGGTVALVPAAALGLFGASLALGAAFLARLIPERFAQEASSLAALFVSALLFMACSVPRLDLFSPLSMEVMKFVHDFVHQFFESMLIPDHPFFRSDVWEYIGFLFGDDVGFWGGLVIWFAPVLLVALSVRLQRLPSVAHIRQGASRRKLLAEFIRQRRYRLSAPILALLFLSGAAYQSRFPSVEYWDPKPMVVTASPTGEILIPKKGEINLEDGKLHKFVYRQGGREARFFLVRTPAGLAANLDACAICKPDGYGQSGEMVICYYCKTLIPLSTVGKPGGCNPVPVRFVSKGDAVSIDGSALLNTWMETVQATTRVKEEGR